MFIAYRPRNRQAPSERHVQMLRQLNIAPSCWRAPRRRRPNIWDTTTRVPPNRHCRLTTDQMRKSEILRAINFSNTTATSITEIDLPVSLSIEVMATFEIPHGVI